jgi:altronate dehydratase
MAKAGSTNLVDMLHYAEPVTKKGFVFMDTPGYDPVAATGQVAGGANMVCFTTGRGSVVGCKPAPSIKLAPARPRSANLRRQEYFKRIFQTDTVRLGDWQPEADNNFFVQILETCTCVNQQ